MPTLNHPCGLDQHTLQIELQDAEVAYVDENILNSLIAGKTMAKILDIYFVLQAI